MSKYLEFFLFYFLKSLNSVKFVCTYIDSKKTYIYYETKYISENLRNLKIIQTSLIDFFTKADLVLI